MPFCEFIALFVKTNKFGHIGFVTGFVAILCFFFENFVTTCQLTEFYVLRMFFLRPNIHCVETRVSI